MTQPSMTTHSIDADTAHALNIGTTIAAWLDHILGNTGQRTASLDYNAGTRTLTVHAWPPDYSGHAPRPIVVNDIDLPSWLAPIVEAD